MQVVRQGQVVMKTVIVTCALVLEAKLLEQLGLVRS